MLTVANLNPKASMNKPIDPEPLIPLPDTLAKMEVTVFAEVMAKLTLNELSLQFLGRHRVKTIEDLLRTSVIHETDDVWWALAELRAALHKLEIPGFEPDRHYFTMSTI